MPRDPEKELLKMSCPACDSPNYISSGLCYQCKRCGTRWLRDSLNSSLPAKVITTEIIREDPAMSKIQAKSGPKVSWDKQDVMEWVKMGKSQNSISAKFKISTATIGRIRKEMRESGEIK